MFIGRDSELDIVRRVLASERGSGEPAIVSIHGIFGAGKTTLLRRIREIAEQERLVDGVMATDEDFVPGTIPDFAFALATGLQSHVPDIYRAFVNRTEAGCRRFALLPQSGTMNTSPMSDDDHRLMLEPGNVMAEAIILDLIDTFYRRAGEQVTDAPKMPRRILVIIDTYEKITAVVNPWLLESLLPYLFQKRFSDFRAHELSGLPERAHVRDFLDVRFIVAGRERLSFTDPERRWDRYREQLREMRIGPFTHEELARFLELSGFDGAEQVDQVEDLTQGLPYLASLWVDVAQDSPMDGRQAFLNARAEERIFWYKTPEQREWIRSAAFLDWFDADALRCLEPVGDAAPRAFEYLRNSSEVARPSPSRAGKFELHAIIRQALRLSTEQESGDRAQYFREAAASFYGAADILERFATNERRLLRKLAYFARFDDLAIERLFGSEAHSVRSLMVDASDLFVRSGTGWALEPECRERLARYNRFADRTTWQASLDSAANLWTARKREILDGILSHREEVRSIDERLRQLAAALDARGDLRDRTGMDMRDLELELQRARGRWYQRLSARETLVGRASFFLLAISLLLVFFAQAIPVDARTQSLIRTAALGMACLFLLVLSLAVGRMLYLKSRRQEHAALRDDVMSIETRLSSARIGYHELAAQTAEATAEVESLTRRRAGLLEEIERMEVDLESPYV